MHCFQSSSYLPQLWISPSPSCCRPLRRLQTTTPVGPSERKPPLIHPSTACPHARPNRWPPPFRGEAPSASRTQPSPAHTPYEPFSLPFRHTTTSTILQTAIALDLESFSPPPLFYLSFFFFFFFPFLPSLLITSVLPFKQQLKTKDRRRAILAITPSITSTLIAEREPRSRGRPRCYFSFLSSTFLSNPALFVRLQQCADP